MKNPTIFLAALAALAACAPLAHAETTVPSVTSITKAGKSFSSRLEVEYTIDNPAVVTFDLYTNGVPVDAALLGTATGDVFKRLDAGTHRFTWRVVDALPADMRITGGGAVVRVKAWPLGQPPDYMVIDLTESEGDIAYYDDAGQLPDGIGDDAYKTTKLVMRKIPAAYLWWKAGCPTNATGTTVSPRMTLLSSDYYMGVYELTEAQRNRLMGGADLTSCKPRRDSWNGFSTALETYSDYAGLSFRMPTSAEWEFACRAGSTNDLYTGENLADATVSANLDAIAWYGYNSGSTAGDTQTAALHDVGLLAPNAYGLYDTLGNVWEWCSDWNGGYTMADQTDPTGVASGTQRVRRGGAFDSPALRCTTHAILGNAPNYSADSASGVTGSTLNNQGLRLCAPCRAVR
ncbi:MAG: formylglycine-generating enzyme family protein [Kiritimatiellae bacterium]|nr:formylglycine-generating enzyme family protein [Kiritimatiellia bacterium]